MSRPSSNSWKNYGGTYKHDNLQNVTLGTLVADNIILRQDYASEFLVQGNIVVFGDASFSGNAYYAGNTFTKELFCKSDTYIQGNLYIGTNDLQNNTNYAYIHGNSTNIGINTTTPRSAFDIVGKQTTDDTGDTVLTVRSTTHKNFNIISENVDNHGIATYTEDTPSTSTSKIQFYNSTSTISSSLPDGSIGYTTNSQTSTGFLELKSKNIRLDASNTIISSNVNPNNPTSYYDETLIIYDSSNQPYLIDSYNKDSVQTGNAVTLVAIDQSSNTSLKIIDPSLKGISIGGGNFAKDNTRAMGYIGINSLKNGKLIYHQPLTIVSGNSTTNYKSTIGINTYSPKTETYALDINGPTRIGNGELTTRITLNFEVTSMSFSKINKNYGIICGKSISTTFPYILCTSITNDGGKTWSVPVPIDKAANLQMNITPTNICCYVYDSRYAIIGSTNNNIGTLYITKDGGHSWSVLSNTQNQACNYFSFYMYLYQESSSDVILLYYIAQQPNIANGIPNNNYVAYCTITSTTFTNRAFTEIIINNNTDITACDGFDNKLYFIGNNTVRHINDIKNPSLQNFLNRPTIPLSTFKHNSIFSYDNNFITGAVDNYIFSTTDGGTNWSNTPITVDFPLNSIYLYDSNNGIAVGNAGSIYYTVTSGKEWKKVPENLINSSGISTILTDPANTLTNVFMPDINSFIISVTTQKYSQTSTGKSKILYGYFPNLFNHANNKVLDVSGNMVISGDINIEDRLFIQRDVSLNGNLNVWNTNSSINSENFDSLSNNLNIGPSINSAQIINIGTQHINGPQSTQTPGKKIYIGGISDTVILRGNIISDAQQNQVISNPNFILNKTLDDDGNPPKDSNGDIINNTSSGSGIIFYDIETNHASSGSFVISNDKNGFNLKPTNLNSKTLNLNINSMVLDSNTNNGLIILQKSTNTADSDFTMTSMNIDTSSILIRNKISTDSNQIIDSSLSLTNLIIGDSVSKKGSLAVYGSIFQFASD